MSPATTTSNGSRHGPARSLEEVAGHGVVEERRARARSLRVELDPREVPAVAADAPRELAGAEAEVEDGEACRPREDPLEEDDRARSPGSPSTGIAGTRGERRPQSGDLWAIGTRRPVPNAFAETFRPGCGLPPLVLGDDPSCRAIFSTRARGAPLAPRGRGEGEVALDEALENRVEDGVGRQRVLVRLAGPELGGRRLREGRVRDQRTGRPARSGAARGRRRASSGGPRSARGRRTCRRRACSSPTASSLLFPVVRTSAPSLFEKPITRSPRSARLDVLLGDVLGRPCEDGRERGLRVLEEPADREDLEADAEVLREGARVRDGALGRVRRRHPEPRHVLLPECVDGERGDERRVDPAGQAEDGRAEAALARVVADAEDERAAERLERLAVRVVAADARRRRPRRATTRARPSAPAHDVRDEEVLLEERRAGARRGHGRRGPSSRRRRRARRFHRRDSGTRPARARPAHNARASAACRLRLALRERRGRNREDEGRAAAHERLAGIGVIEAPLPPEVLVVPEVLADGQPDRARRGTGRARSRRPARTSAPRRRRRTSGAASSSRGRGRARGGGARRRCGTACPSGGGSGRTCPTRSAVSRVLLRERAERRARPPAGTRAARGGPAAGSRTARAPGRRRGRRRPPRRGRAPPSIFSALPAKSPMVVSIWPSASRTRPPYGCPAGLGRLDALDRRARRGGPRACGRGGRRPRRGAERRRALP